MKRLRPLWLTGFFATLLIWLMPARFKPYFIKHDFEDFKILLVEKDSELGFDPDGVVKIDTMLALGLPPGGNREMLVPERAEYISRIEKSRVPWPVQSWKFHYDEWGPSHTTRPDGVESTLQGNVYCVPYSFGLIVFGLPLLWLRITRPSRKVPAESTSAKSI